VLKLCVFIKIDIGNIPNYVALWAVASGAVPGPS
jgi:hypothetical protein